MTTLQQLVDQCAAELDDPTHAVFAAADVEQWCRDAIGDYSLHFPRVVSKDLTTTAEDRSYDLDAGVVGVLTVEYPLGEEPPAFLRPRNRRQARFWLANDSYDVIRHRDETAPAEVWISPLPAAGETIRVVYQKRHDNELAAAATLTVPLQHQHLLKNYAIWRAALQLLHDEEAAPTSNSSLLMGQLAANADRARRQYVDGLAKALFADSESASVSWAGQDEAAGRIY
jgi:hypothetical protein